MALESIAARRYAEALLDACTQAGQPSLSQVREELDRFATAVETVFDLKNVLLNPIFGADERQHALTRVMEKLGLSEVTRRFLFLVEARDRMPELGAIAGAFSKLAHEREGRIRARIESAAELSESAAEQLRRALERRTGKTVELDVVIVPELIGGLRAQVGSMVFDGTLRAELERLRATLG